jgi:uncharacterized protein (TIGR00369 family)
MAQSSSSSFTELLGMQFEGDQGAVRVSIDVDDRHRQRNGVVHGSVIHALLDTAMGIAAHLACGREPVATAEISVRFLEPVFDGRVEASARVLKAGKRLIVVEGEVHRAGMRVAVGQGSFTPIRRSEGTQDS